MYPLNHCSVVLNGRMRISPCAKLKPWEVSPAATPWEYAEHLLLLLCSSAPSPLCRRWETAVSPCTRYLWVPQMEPLDPSGSSSLDSFPAPEAVGTACSQLPGARGTHSEVYEGSGRRASQKNQHWSSDFDPPSRSSWSWTSLALLQLNPVSKISSLRTLKNLLWSEFMLLFYLTIALLLLKSLENAAPLMGYFR